MYKILIICLILLQHLSLSGQSDISNDDSKGKSAASHLVIKISPFDFMIGRYLLSAEYRLEKNNSLEITFFTDYMKRSDPFKGLQDFGQMYHASLRYKFYFAQGKLSEKKRSRMNGFYYAPGIVAGITPILDGTVPTSYSYIPDRQSEKSSLVGLSSDLGYAISFGSFNLEAFWGLEYARHSRSAIMYTDHSGNSFFEEMPFLSPRIRVGLRIGFYLL